MSDQHLVNRRDFVKTAGGAVAATSLLGADAFAQTPAAGRKRYAIIGTGERATGMWGRQIRERYSDVVEFVGLCDINPKRVEAAKALMGVDCATYTNFDEMIAKAKPDVIMVTTKDSTHSDYIVRALDKGLDVMTEKPMVIDEKQCQAVLDAEKRNKKKIIVTFNYRFAPKHQAVKELIMAGEIGRVLSVDFAWYLDVYHGADYFRRWHAYKNGGGSLWVHKATHHFDLVNWWLGADPVEVEANGQLQVYGKNGKIRGTNCRVCPHKKECRFYYDLNTNPTRMRLYAGAEDVDGYYRDGCVYRQDIDIYDSMQAIVKYSNGATMAYSLDAHMPYEGYSVGFNGEFGRIDVRDYERQPWEVPEENETEIYVTKSFGLRRRVTFKQGEGGHGGGDDFLRNQIFRQTPAPEHMRLPDSRAGAMSCLTGIAARKSIEEKRAVKIKDLVTIT